MTGLEQLNALLAGEIPPPGVATALDIWPVEFAPARAVFSLTPDERHMNPLGPVHGGILSTLLDSAMGCAVHTMLPAGATYTTLQLDVKFVRPVLAGAGRVLAEGTVIHAGRRTATAEGTVRDEAGAVYAHATTTCLVLATDRAAA